jgi:molybdopterin molybdotransferase
MISFDEAVELVRSVAEPVGTETIALTDAAGRVLAVPVAARIDSPRSDVSAMDGYAMRDSDVANFPVELEMVGESFAGAGWNGTVGAGTCARIFTGAPLPTGANRVIIQENVRRDGDKVIIDEFPGAARHIRKRGSDFETGEELLPVGRLLDPRAIVAAAAADVAEVHVYRLPRLHILSTGDELAEPGTALTRTDAIPESVSFGVAALAEQWGARCVARTRLRDDLTAMRRAAESAIGDADVVVVTGGASVGEKDFAKPMFEPLGLELVFSKVAIKPGKPVWVGKVRGTLVIGLPGNPTSALVTARLFLAPLLAGLGGRPTEAALRWRTLPLATALEPCGSRETFHRARLTDGTAEILSFQDSSAQKALAQADLLVRQRVNSPAIERGAEVEVLDF